jgi:hypothetical protein
MQKRQANADTADDHNSDSAKEGPPKIVVGALLLEPLSFSKRCGIGSELLLRSSLKQSRFALLTHKIR